MLKNVSEKVFGEAPVDLIITGAKVFNVFTMEFMQVDVMIDQGMIIGFGTGSAKKIISAKGKYLVPGLIDAHMHIESTMLTPIEYSKVALANGVTTAFADCHEIANVLGTAGIDYMLSNVKRALMDINLMLPSSVPCSSLSNDNNKVDAKDLCNYYSNPCVYGLAEVMDYKRVESGDLDYLQKMQDCASHKLVVDGHMAGLDAKQVEVLRNHAVSTDHECETKSDLLERLSRGVAVHIREGSAAKNFTELMGAVTVANNSRISFCTDDVSIVDLIDNGSINNIIRKGIREGYQPELLLKMATYNAARAYNLTNKGAIAPGYVADLLIIDDMTEFKIDSVFKDGVDVSSLIDFNLAHEQINDENIIKSVNIKVDETTIDLTPKYNLAIEVHNGSLITQKAQVSSEEAKLLPKIVVINRYGKDDYFVSYLKGMNITNQVIASSISHDYHNIVIIGNDDEQIRAMISKIKQSNGGIYALIDNQFTSLPLEVAGLMSYESITDTYTQFKKLLAFTNKLGIDEPFLAMSFLTLDVIPYLKITDIGLYDFATNKLLT